MEVYYATDNPQGKDSFKNKLERFFNSFNQKQWIGVISILVIVLSIFLTTALSSRVQRFFSRAASPPGSYGSGNYGSGRYPGISATTFSPFPSGSGKPGDTDGDNDIDIFDYNLVVSDFGKTNDSLTRGDLDSDDDVDIFDYNLVVSNFGK